MNQLLDTTGELSAGVSFAGEITLTEEFAYREWSRWGWRSPKGDSAHSLGRKRRGPQRAAKP